MGKAKSKTKQTMTAVWSAGAPTFAVVPPGKCQFTPEFKSVELLNKIKICSNTYVFSFATPDRQQPLNLPTCACILAKATIGGENVIRPYTPCSTNALVGSFDIMVKIYPQGKMTQHLAGLEVGDQVEFKHIDFNVKLQYPFERKKIGMIVGGSGITPMIQALHALLGNGEDDTEVLMLYGSKTRETILAHDVLNEWETKYPQLKVTHVLSQEPEGTGNELRGRITKDLVEKTFGNPTENDIKVFLCGPPAMYETFCGARNEKTVTGIMAELGYDENTLYKF